MENIEFKHKLVAKDYGNFLVFIAFQRNGFNRIFLNYVMPILGALLLVVAIIAQVNDFFLYFLSIFVLLFGLIFRLLYHTMGKLAFRKTPLLGLENTYIFSDEHILGQNERGEQKYYYEDINRIYENKEYFFIALGGSLYIFISKNTVGSHNTETLKQYLVNKVPDKCRFLQKNKHK